MEDSVILLDEEGREVEFDHLLTFKHEDKKYIAVMPVDEVEGVGEDEVLILEIVSQADEDTYLPVENQVLLEELFQVFLELYDELLDEQEELDEE